MIIGNFFLYSCVRVLRIDPIIAMKSKYCTFNSFEIILSGQVTGLIDN